MSLSNDVRLTNQHIDPLRAWLCLTGAEDESKALIPVANISYVYDNTIYLKDGRFILIKNKTFEEIVAAIDDVLVGYVTGTRRR